VGNLLNFYWISVPGRAGCCVLVRRGIIHYVDSPTPTDASTSTSTSTSTSWPKSWPQKHPLSSQTSTNDVPRALHINAQNGPAFRWQLNLRFKGPSQDLILFFWRKKGRGPFQGHALWLARLSKGELLRCKDQNRIARAANCQTHLFMSKQSNFGQSNVCRDMRGFRIYKDVCMYRNNHPAKLSLALCFWEDR